MRLLNLKFLYEIATYMIGNFKFTALGTACRFDAPSEAPPQTDEACCAKTSLSFRAKSLAEGQWLRTRPFETLASLAPQGEVLVLRSARSARLEAPGSPPLCFGAPE